MSFAAHDSSCAAFLCKRFFPPPTHILESVLLTNAFAGRTDVSSLPLERTRHLRHRNKAVLPESAIAFTQNLPTHPIKAAAVFFFCLSLTQKPTPQAVSATAEVTSWLPAVAIPFRSPNCQRKSFSGSILVRGLIFSGVAGHLKTELTILSAFSRAALMIRSCFSPVGEFSSTSLRERSTVFL